MKKALRTVALCTLLASFATSCQKENINPYSSEVSQNEQSAMYTVSYSVDGVSHSKALPDDNARMLFLHDMLRLATEGADVNFRITSSGQGIQSPAGAKEIITFSTSSKDEAYAWCDKMSLSGYTVSIRYDEEKKIYNCYAIN